MVSSSPPRKGARRSRFLLLLLVALTLASTLLVSPVSAAGEACSATKKCPSSSPCCSAGGTCGSGADHCAGGCQALASFTSTSCLANPICVNQNITFTPTSFKDDSVFKPILRYNGDPTLAPLTLDMGFLGAGSEGVDLQLTAPVQAKLSTTRYMLYGSVSLRARYAPQAGVVFAFITMSDVKDEIDWEMTGATGTAKSNFFGLGQVAKRTDADINPAFDVSAWHTYGLNWTPDRLSWSVDGQVRRTIQASNFPDSFPRSPSRIQISVWSGGNSTNAPGTIEWAGGATDWSSSSYTENGAYSAEISNLQINCASQSAASLQTNGTGTNVTSWVYTGGTSNGRPTVQLSTTPISFLANPQQDGHAGLPGYGTENPGSDPSKNLWDGSGSTSSPAPGKSSSSSGNWFTKQHIIIVAAAVGGLFLLLFAWALIVRMCRKRRRNASLAAGAPTGISPKSATLSNAGLAAAGFGAVSKGDGYKQVKDDAWDEESDYDDKVPEGAARMGQGYGPAVGPAPSRTFNNLSATPGLPPREPKPHARFASSEPPYAHSQGHSQASSGGHGGHEQYAMAPVQARQPITPTPFVPPSPNPSQMGYRPEGYPAGGLRGYGAYGTPMPGASQAAFGQPFYPQQQSQHQPQHYQHQPQQPYPAQYDYGTPSYPQGGAYAQPSWMNQQGR